MWQQELHKYQVSVLEAEACHKDLQKAQEGLTRLMPGTRRLSFDQIYKFMEEQLRVWLKQASQVWVQVSLLRGDLSKARVKRERRREKDSRRAMILEEENQRCGARLEELRCAMRETEREVDRLSLISGRIEMRVQRVNTSTKSKLLTLKSSPLQPTEVDEYLQLNGDIHKLRKEVAWWKRRAGDPV
ncbi:hypothetical protein E2C01_047476 [Portunus trituberculatus]|uniref:Uncharacterized protein n=1 Tax=Portunus trituberculatus TaxID=210409 RepID=A0A5B7G179_PORTR|nr:hypothetical protein [Portunus trituberculatus]